MVDIDSIGIIIKGLTFVTAVVLLVETGSRSTWKP